jgi:DnaA-homolog protein
MHVAPQLVLDLIEPEPPAFENFLAGQNEELVAQVRDLVAGRRSKSSLYLWGSAGVGKTHLLRAAERAARAVGRQVAVLDAPASPVDSGVQPMSAPLVVVDRVDQLSDAQQAWLFTVYNDMRAQGGALLVAGRQPIAGLTLREDLRTRLGWGLVYEVQPLREDARVAALAAYAEQRGFHLPREVLAYMFDHARRDLPALLALLAALDRYSLAAKRPITVPLTRDLLQSLEK